MWQYIPTEELYHHGIIGQKWGVRRYQNKDGSLTAKGKKRLSSDDIRNARQISDEVGKIANTINSKISTDKKTKKDVDLSKISDAEMQKTIQRYNLEKRYKEIITSDNASKGKEVVKNVLSVAGTVTGIASSGLAIALAVKELQKG